MKLTTQAEGFYTNLLGLLLKQEVPFMVGGTYAFSSYTGIYRPTKDMDLVSTHELYPQILKVSSEAGYRTELLDPNWLAKVYNDHYFADVIFAERNGLHKVNTSWLRHARVGEVLGHQVKLMPVEEMIRSKAYIQFKDKYDGADVIHLILLYGKTLDWNLLLSTMNPHWEILFAHILNFSFVYPSERDVIPSWIIAELMKRVQNSFSSPTPTEKITRGLLISSQYNVAIEKWGFKPVQNLR